jgi:hypothetical protein
MNYSNPDLKSNKNELLKSILAILRFSNKKKTRAKSKMNDFVAKSFNSKNYLREQK